MFTKPKHPDVTAPPPARPAPHGSLEKALASELPGAQEKSAPAGSASAAGRLSPAAETQAAPAPKTGPSLLSADISLTGNLATSGQLQIEGTVDGDVRAHKLSIGETATIRGEVVADDLVVQGKVSGRIRALKVRLATTARVEGDIVHKTISIEAGAYFEGSVRRTDDPFGDAGTQPKPGADTAAGARRATPATERAESDESSAA